MLHKKERVVYFDLLNIFAIISVIAMHCNGIVHGNPMNKGWGSSLLVDCIFYWAVPIFLMLSGATLMKYREKYDTKTFFKKRFQKEFSELFLPFQAFEMQFLGFSFPGKEIKDV